LIPPVFLTFLPISPSLLLLYAVRCFSKLREKAYSFRFVAEESSAFFLSPPFKSPPYLGSMARLVFLNRAARVGACLTTLFDTDSCQFKI